MTTKPSVVDISKGMYAVWAEVNTMTSRAVAARSYANPQTAIDTWAATTQHVADIVVRNRNFFYFARGIRLPKGDVPLRAARE